MRICVCNGLMTPAVFDNVMLGGDLQEPKIIRKRGAH